MKEKIKDIMSLIGIIVFVIGLLLISLDYAHTQHDVRELIKIHKAEFKN